MIKVSNINHKYNNNIVIRIAFYSLIKIIISLNNKFVRHRKKPSKELHLRAFLHFTSAIYAQQYSKPHKIRRSLPKKIKWSFILSDYLRYLKSL